MLGEDYAAVSWQLSAAFFNLSRGLFLDYVDYLAILFVFHSVLPVHSRSLS